VERYAMKADEFQKHSRSKYRNVEVTEPNTGEIFDSKREYKRWCELKLLQKARIISDLKRQTVYELQPKFTDNWGKNWRAITYTADMEYEENGKLILEEVKGVETDLWKVKEKLFRKKFPTVELRIIK
jgi:Fe2+ transport system protein B